MKTTIKTLQKNLILLSGVFIFLSQGINIAQSAEVWDALCRLHGAAELPSGGSMSGEIHDEGGAVSGSWTYKSSTGDEFIAELSATTSSLLCRVNGSNVADVRTAGTWNGVAGYNAMLNVQDYRSSPQYVLVPGSTEIQTLTATRLYSPSRWFNGLLSYPLGAQVEIPASLPVTVGNAGNQWSFLNFTRVITGDQIRCMYRGGASTANPKEPVDIELGQTVTLARCEQLDANGDWNHDPALVAGVKLGVSDIVLHVQHGSSKDYSSTDAEVETTISFGLEVTPNVLKDISRHDFARIAVFDPTGARVYLDEGDIDRNFGDFHVELMP